MDTQVASLMGFLNASFSDLKSDKLTNECQEMDADYRAANETVPGHKTRVYLAYILSLYHFARKANIKGVDVPVGPLTSWDGTPVVAGNDLNMMVETLYDKVSTHFSEAENRSGPQQFCDMYTPSMSGDKAYLVESLAAAGNAGATRDLTAAQCVEFNRCRIEGMISSLRFYRPDGVPVRSQGLVTPDKTFLVSNTQRTVRVVNPSTTASLVVEITVGWNLLSYTTAGANFFQAGAGNQGFDMATAGPVAAADQTYTVGGQVRRVGEPYTYILPPNVRPENSLDIQITTRLLSHVYQMEVRTCFAYDSNALNAGCISTFYRILEGDFDATRGDVSVFAQNLIAERARFVNMNGTSLYTIEGIKRLFPPEIMPDLTQLTRRIQETEVHQFRNTRAQGRARFH